jgi:P63C domain
MAKVVTGKAKGGVARAKSLTGLERSEIAKRAAKSRWSGDIPYAEYGSSDRPLLIGGWAIPCYVLNDERRVVTFNGIISALGMKKGGQGYSKGRGDRLTRFVTGATLKPFVSNNLLQVIEDPIRFRLRSASGTRNAFGYEATILADICELVLSARAAGALRPQQMHIADRCEILVRAFARVGIIALVDEATGYQRDRAKDALAEILEQFIAKELQPYIRTFPSEFYEEMFRLRALEYPREGAKRPQYFGHLTNDIIYARLAPGVLDELRDVTPKREDGRRQHPFTRWLTQDVGHPKLREHLASVVTIMKLSTEYDDFEVKIDRIHPRYDETLALPLLDKDGRPV